MLSTLSWKKLLWAGALVMVAMLPQHARAALGAAEASVAADARELKATVKLSEQPLYRLHEIQLSTGTRLREFVGADGVVFAVAWNGPAIPDLRQLLGAYFDAYVSAARTSHGSRNHVDLRQDDWVVQSSGRMRAFSGRAYLPLALPIGFSLTEIR